MKKFSSLLVVLLLMLASFTAGVEYQRGDVDQDGLVGISDVTCLIDYLLNGTWPDEPVSPDNHEWVDLGLPSGTLWATCNVGANVPEEYGDYFAWGETEPKDVYSWETYKWCNGTNNTLTKYCTNSNYGDNGFTDGKMELELEDDAAYVNWGHSWRMPTAAQQRELFDNGIWTWTTRNGMKGCLVTGPNGNSIFLPASGYRWGESLYNAGSIGYYWSNTNVAGGDTAYNLYFNSSELDWCGHDLNSGFTVRPVRVSQN